MAIIPATLVAQINHVLDCVAQDFGLERQELLSPRRFAYVAKARLIAEALAYEIPDVSYNMVAHVMDLHYSTVVHARKVVARKCQEDPVYKARVQRIRDVIKTPVAA